MDVLRLILSSEVVAHDDGGAAEAASGAAKEAGDSKGDDEAMDGATAAAEGLGSGSAGTTVPSE